MMTSSLEGAKLARKEIEKFHVLLNLEYVVPEQCYRMSHPHYSMVCYTNQIVALFISRNFHVIPLFIDRAFKQLKRFEGQPNTEKYRAIVYDYLCQMAYYIVNFTNTDLEWYQACIPQEILEAGARVAPEYNTQTLHLKA